MICLDTGIPKCWYCVKGLACQNGWYHGDGLDTGIPKLLILRQWSWHWYTKMIDLMKRLFRIMHKMLIFKCLNTGMPKLGKQPWWWHAKKCLYHENAFDIGMPKSWNHSNNRDTDMANCWSHHKGLNSVMPKMLISWKESWNWHAKNDLYTGIPKWLISWKEGWHWRTKIFDIVRRALTLACQKFDIMPKTLTLACQNSSYHEKSLTLA